MMSASVVAMVMLVLKAGNVEDGGCGDGLGITIKVTDGAGDGSLLLCFEAAPHTGRMLQKRGKEAAVT